MQPILDGPRSALPERLVRSLLQSDRTLQISYGAVALDGDFHPVADIAEYVSTGSEIRSNADAVIHRTISINIDSNVTDTGWSYLSGFVKPYLIFSDPENGDSARFNLGVYTLTTPTRALGVTPATLNFQGYDLVYLLQQPIGDSYEVPAGADPALAAAEAIGLAVPGVDVIVEDSGSTLAQRLSWPFDPSQPVTYLDVIQTLLEGIGYQPAWVDWEGRFRIEPFADPQKAPVEWTFDLTASDNLVSDDRNQSVDMFDVPNWWRFVQADLKDLPVEGVTMFTWEDDSSMNPGSTVNRGRRVRHIEEVPSSSFEDLLDYAQRRIAEMLTPAEEFDVKTQPFPLAWHRDLIEYLDPALAKTLPAGPGARRYVVSVEWTLPLDGAGDMDWKWQAVIDQNVLGVYEVTEEVYDPNAETVGVGSGSFSGSIDFPGTRDGGFTGTLVPAGTFTGEHPA